MASNTPPHVEAMSPAADEDLAVKVEAEVVDQLADEPPVDNLASTEGDGDAANNVEVHDQVDLERDIGRQADHMIKAQQDEKDQVKIDKLLEEKRKHEAALERLDRQFSMSAVTRHARNDITKHKERMARIDTSVEIIQARMQERHSQWSQEDLTKRINESEDRSKQLHNESRKDYLIRTGKITPFAPLPSNRFESSANLSETLINAEDEARFAAEEERSVRKPDAQLRSHQNLVRPGFQASASDDESDLDDIDDRATKRRRRSADKTERGASPASGASADDSDAYVPDGDVLPSRGVGEAETSEDEKFRIETDASAKTPTRKRKLKKVKVEDADSSQEEVLVGVDDGDITVYKSRLRTWTERRSAARRKERLRQRRQANGVGEGDHHQSYSEDSEGEEWFKSHPSQDDGVFSGGLRVPGDIYPLLFDYQKTGVQWLWELYSQQTGGIVGDEMGLGKTIQVIALLAALHHSKKLNDPIIIVCPATVMSQWVMEFHRWWPPLRVSVLHSTGSGMANLRTGESDDELQKTPRSTKRDADSRRVINRVFKTGHVLITTYAGLRTYAPSLVRKKWGYAVLDEGHKIRNPNAAITIMCKELVTPNRIILSGTPMQNNLQELWSLFDFVYPMRLGTLFDFRLHFEFPIKSGGSSNATSLQIQTAMHCAAALKDAVAPYLLQRYKEDVASDLPEKEDKVVKVKLTKFQADEYEQFLASSDVKAILAGKRQALYGIDICRKICNHPDLVDHKGLSVKPGYNYGEPTKSGKIMVTKSLLRLWKSEGHKTLLFAQHRIMLDILEKCVGDMPEFKYLRMDGTTPIRDRQAKVDLFNNSDSLDVFLLTTKVGGLGINLTGASRVLIFDPDWNPSTDDQARERAYRLGQKKGVVIIRLLTKGTIEEKIYQRQMFKKHLTNKVLQDPSKRHTLQLGGMADLFTLGGDEDKDAENNMINTHAGTGPARKENRDAVNGRQERRLDADITRIEGVVNQESYAPPTEDHPDDRLNSKDNLEVSSSASKRSKDTRLLASIFDPTIHELSTHASNLANSTAPNRKKRAVQADPAIIQKEARRVADEAVAELKRAEEVARSVPAGTPTWTGMVGVAGRPDPAASSSNNNNNNNNNNSNSNRHGGGGIAGLAGPARHRAGGAGPSSASILANLSARQRAGSSTADNPSQSTAPAPQSHQRPRASSSSSRGPLADILSRNRQLRGPPNIHVRVGNASSPSSARPLTTTTTTTTTTATEEKGLPQRIKTFLLAHGGAAYTSMLSDHFGRLCRSERETEVFRAVLERVAVLEGAGSAAGSGSVSGSASASGAASSTTSTSTSTGGGSGGIAGSDGRGGAGIGGVGRGKWVLRREFGGRG